MIQARWIELWVRNQIPGSTAIQQVPVGIDIDAVARNRCHSVDASDATFTDSGWQVGRDKCAEEAAKPAADYTRGTH